MSELVDAYQSGFDSVPGTRAISDFACSPVPELQVSCSRPSDAASVALVFGPGGRGLQDCGQSPITEDAELGHVRAGGIGCNGARGLIFAAMTSGEPTALEGYGCERVEVAGSRTVSCEARDAAIAFTLPVGES